MKNENECEVKQLIVRVEPDLKMEFNVKCIQNKTTMQQVLSDYISEYVKK